MGPAAVWVEGKKLSTVGLILHTIPFGGRHAELKIPTEIITLKNHNYRYDKCGIEENIDPKNCRDR